MYNNVYHNCSRLLNCFNHGTTKVNNSSVVVDQATGEVFRVDELIALNRAGQCSKELADKLVKIN